ncbi:Phage terminase-like protein, large subunit, contains N-terminal HTH domain [Tardiphaga sp. OK246]|nr:Phage terminase-like protein, large subunit, contains N-terminal HTH domain [Tardiphaga sp. OK246]
MAASSKRFPSDPTTQYARDVVDGKIVSGELACYAAERHLKDILEGSLRDLYWAPERAQHAFDFYPSVLSITEGAADLVGKPFNLLPWHMFSAGNLFGWRRSSGRMRFRSGWLETGKGQAKSPFMAGTGLYMMGYYGIPRAKVFAIGQDKATANVLFKDAAAMCRAPIPGSHPEDGHTLESLGEVIIRGFLDNAFKIEHPSTKSVFQSLANGDAISGPKPTLVSADEIHEFKSNASLETWMAAIAKMPGDALMLMGTNTPASTQLVGTEYSTFYQSVLKGEFIDDQAFGFIARVDKADHDKVFENEACWVKSLPALGITFPVENIRGEVNTARKRTSKAMSVKRLYFGIPIGAVSFWMDNEEAWAAVQAPVDPADHKGEKCWLSLDLSKKNDLTALSACWEGMKDGERHLFVKTWYWTVQDGLADRARRDLAKYVEWAADPDIDFTAVPGATIDKTFAAAEVATLVAEHDVQFLAFDVAGMADFIAACETTGLPVWKFEGPDKPEGYGLKLVSHAQGKRRVFEEKQLTMPTSVEKLEDNVLDGTITIDDSPVTYMCAANAYVDRDGQDNRCFDKSKSRGRIDGLVTTAMVVGAASGDFKEGNDLGDFLKNAVTA